MRVYTVKAKVRGTPSKPIRTYEPMRCSYEHERDGIAYFYSVIDVLSKSEEPEKAQVFPVLIVFDPTGFHFAWSDRFSGVEIDWGWQKSKVYVELTRIVETVHRWIKCVRSDTDVFALHDFDTTTKICRYSAGSLSHCPWPLTAS